MISFKVHMSKLSFFPQKIDRSETIRMMYSFPSTGKYFQSNFNSNMPKIGFFKYMAVRKESEYK